MADPTDGSITQDDILGHFIPGYTPTDAVSANNGVDASSAAPGDAGTYQPTPLVSGLSPGMALAAQHYVPGLQQPDIPDQYQTPNQPLLQAPEPMAQSLPGLAAPTSFTPALQPGQSQSQSGSSSTRQFSEDNYSKISKKASDLDKRNAIARDKANAEGNRIAGEFNAASAEERAAIGQQTEAEAAKNDATGRGYSEMAALGRQTATEIKAIHDKASADAAADKAKYQQSLAEWQSMHVDPGRLWKSWNTGEKVGAIATAFVQGFLGAKGIQTHGWDFVEKGIDRDIQAQMEEIRKKGQVTEGFKTLWEMTRAQSASDMEAATKMRGYYLADMENQVKAEVSKYDSNVLRANGAAALAKVAQERAKNDFAVSKQTDDNYSAEAQRNTQVHIANINAAIENSRTAEARAERQDRAAAERAKAEAEVKKKLLPDINPSGGGKMAYVMIRGSEKEQQDAREEITNIAHMNADIREFRALVRKGNGAQSGVAQEQLNDTEQKKLRALALSIIAIKKKIETGMAASAAEMAALESRYPIEHFTTRGDANQVETLWAGAEARGYEKAQRIIQTYADDLPTEGPGSEYREYRGAQHQWGNAERTDARTTHENDAEALPTPTDIAVKTATRKDFNAKADPETYKKAGVDRDTTDLDWQTWVKKSGGLTGDKRYYTGKFFDSQDDKKYYSNNTPAFAVGEAGLVEAAKKGDKQALDKLVRDASEDPLAPNNELNPSASSSERGLHKAWAQYQLYTLSRTATEKQAEKLGYTKETFRQLSAEVKKKEDNAEPSTPLDLPDDQLKRAGLPSNQPADPWK